MEEPPLFDVTVGTGKPQTCDHCSTGTTETLDGLRVRGWVAYDGTSFTGKPLIVRICPTCLRSKGEGHDSTRDGLAPVPQVHPHLPGTDR